MGKDHERGPTSLYGREPDAGYRLPSGKNPKPVPPPEKSKSHSNVDCIALGKPSVPSTKFDESFCHFRSDNDVYGDTMRPFPEGNPWRPHVRPPVAMPNDHVAGSQPSA